MIGGEGSVAFKNNGCGSPRNQPATTGGTNGQGTIDAVIEKHNVTSLVSAWRTKHFDNCGLLIADLRRHRVSTHKSETTIQEKSNQD
jgi:hypothetical protein